MRRLLVFLLIVSPALSAADKTTETMLEILRDVAGLQDQLKGLQRSLEGKLADLSQSGADQVRTTAEQNSKALAAWSDTMQKDLDRQRDQQTKALEAVAALEARCNRSPISSARCARR
ncbi:MAG: hypothetical protein WDO73_11520 [Ignavibacteriota bacterium]